MAFRFDRFLVIALILTSAAVAVSAEDDDVDRTDYSDPALSEDVKLEATGPHSDIETAWILPEAADNKVSIGGMTDLLVAMSNNGAKMFNMSHVDVQLLSADGKVYKELGRYEYGQPLGPREQRSFRYPMELDADTKLGEYTMVALAYYNDKQKSPFFSEVVKEPVTLVPALPDRKAQLHMVQVGLGAVGVLLIVASAAKLLGGGGEKSKGSSSKKDSDKKARGAADDWLEGNLAGSANPSPKKSKAKHA